MMMTTLTTVTRAMLSEIARLRSVMLATSPVTCAVTSGGRPVSTASRSQSTSSSACGEPTGCRSATGRYVASPSSLVSEGFSAGRVAYSWMSATCRESLCSRWARPR
jgi:hypothetical protein